MTGQFTRREMLKLSAVALLAACSSPPPATVPTTELLTRHNSIPLDRLIAEAQKEGKLTTMALRHNWANYGELLERFKRTYGLAVEELNPLASSAEEIDAIKAHLDNSGQPAPDVLDIGLSFAEAGKAAGLLAPYQVATWDTIPERLKDPDSNWACNYYGVLVLEANRTLIKHAPQDWPDLLKPKYKNQVALAGDPTKSNQAIFSVWAAGLSRTGSLDEAPQAGLEFFAELNRAGNFVPIIAAGETLASGQTPILIQWDYLALADRVALKNKPEVDIVVPSSGILGGAYAQAISAYAAHPFAARLWAEFIYSDEGQLLWLKGYAHPIRYNDLVKNNRIPADMATKLPPADLYAKAVFPTPAQITQAKKVIAENWMAQVGVEVKPR
jgi:putative spermidine/putrescine transport system substrate-binding protein